MTTRLSILLFLVILGALVLDRATGAGDALFLLRKFNDFVEYLAFWR